MGPRPRESSPALGSLCGIDPDAAVACPPSSCCEVVVMVVVHAVTRLCLQYGRNFEYESTSAMRS